MTDYRVTFIKDLVAIDAYVRIEDEERQAIEENTLTMGDAWAHYETLLVRRAEELVREKVHSIHFHSDNWDWEIEEL
jgi:hypothetical protein